MSQIDEAFIQAYATPQRPLDAPLSGMAPVVTPQPPLAGLHHGPHIQMSSRMPPATQPAPPVGQQLPPIAQSMLPAMSPGDVSAALQSIVSQTTDLQPMVPQITAPSTPQYPVLQSAASQYPAPTPTLAPLPTPPSSTVPRPPTAWTPEPVPAPHFSVPSEYQVEPAVRPVAIPMYEPAAPMPVSPVSVPPVPSVILPAAPVAVPKTERRPLSTFATPEQPTATEFNPVFEVDAFRWPTVIDSLLHAHHKLLVPVAEQLLTVSEEGRSLVGFAGTRSNVGCATLMLSMARLLASVGKSVVLVDANFAKASLAQDLGLEFQTGWEHALTGELPLAECVVKSLDDNMALLPLTKRTAAANELLAGIQTSVTAGILRYHYDVVLFNLGAAGQPPQQTAAQSIMQHCRLDASIIIADSDTSGSDQDQINPLMSILGSTCLGIIGNNVTR